MHVLVPMDQSECSHRAFEYAVDLVQAMGGRLDVVHFTDAHDERTDELVEVVEETLESAGIEGEIDVVSDIRLSDPRPSSHVGRRILKRAEKEGYDHLVLGHHGTGVVGKLLLGSTVETVVENTDVPTTIVP